MQEQQNDDQIKKILKNMENPNAFTHKQFKMVNDTLIHIGKNNSEQIVIPSSLTNMIITAGHDSPLAGHLGNKKTHQSIIQHFWWKNMKKDIQSHINSCDNFLRKNKVHSKHMAPIQTFEKIGIPFQKIAIDIIGPMSTTANKNRFILVIIDLATRWAEAIPLKEITSDKICTALICFHQIWFSKHHFK
jgi:Integrase zinc binding domain